MKKKTLLRSVNERSLKNSKIKPKLNAKHFFRHSKKTSSVHKIKNKGLLKFPRIIRFFTEKYFLTSLISFILVVTIIIVGLDLYRNIKQKEGVDRERQKIISKIQYWQGITNKYKDYRDAYFQLAVLEYRLRDFDKAKFYLKKTLDIDPNFDKGREFERILNIK